MTADYNLREEMVLLCRRLNVTLVLLPHNSTHRLQPNDMLVHLLEKAGIREILDAIRQCWENENCCLNRAALASGRTLS